MFNNKQVSVEGIDISSLLKAFAKFEKFRAMSTTEIERCGTIQAFGYCFELAFKTMKRILAQRGVITQSPRETFRMAARNGLIDDPEVWFDFIDKRNMTVHTYREDAANEVWNICPIFSRHLGSFIDTVRKQND